MTKISLRKSYFFPEKKKSDENCFIKIHEKKKQIFIIKFQKQRIWYFML